MPRRKRHPYATAINAEPTETTALLESTQLTDVDPKETWFQWARKWGGRGLAVSVGITNAFATACNAIVARIPGAKPGDISWTWFKSLTPWQQFHAVMGFTSSFSLNTYLNYYFNINAKDDFITGLKQSIPISVSSAITGITGAVPTFGISMDSLQWADEKFQISASISGFVSVATARFNATINTITDIRYMNYPEIKYHTVALQKLRWLKKPYVDALNEKLSEKTLNDESLIDAFNALEEIKNNQSEYFNTEEDNLNEQQEDLDNPFNPNSKSARFQKFTRYASYSLPPLFLIGATILFTQKGLDGLLDIENLLNKALKIMLENIKNGTQVEHGFEGLPSGLINALFYAKTSAKFRETFIETCKNFAHAMKDFKNHYGKSSAVIMGYVGLAIMLYYSADAMRGVGKGVVNSTDSIYFSTEEADGIPDFYSELRTSIEDLMKAILPSLAAFMGALVNSVNIAKDFNTWASPAKKGAPATVDNIISFELRRKTSDIITRDYASAFQKLSLFGNLNKSYATEEQIDDVENGLEGKPQSNDEISIDTSPSPVRNVQ